jgi:predicted pyridoxine 5'-phosphate oxidase superfamily flavin-nucleotide-binding protein
LVRIDEDVIRLIIGQGNVVLVGSVSAEGVPNISPRYVLGVMDNEKLLFADAFENKTFNNIKAWPRITVAVFDRNTQGGYQLKGSAENVTDPALLSQAETRLREFGIYEKPKRVWALAIKEVFSLEPSAKSRNPVSHYR